MKNIKFKTQKEMLQNKNYKKLVVIRSLYEITRFSKSKIIKKIHNNLFKLINKLIKKVKNDQDDIRNIQWILDRTIRDKTREFEILKNKSIYIHPCSTHKNIIFIDSETGEVLKTFPGHIHAIELGWVGIASNDKNGPGATFEFAEIF